MAPASPLARAALRETTRRLPRRGEDRQKETTIAEESRISSSWEAMLTSLEGRRVSGEKTDAATEANLASNQA
jgi:hypothetical protein